jgi:WbqC-like protein
VKKVAIVQSNYIPWKGYFDLIASVDEFILFDSMQYTRRDWRNRNLLKTPQGLRWLSIPVAAKGRFLQPIRETKVGDASWRRKHWRSIVQNYGKAPCFKGFADRFETLYLGSADEHLSRINHAFIVSICDLLGIRTRITWDTDYQAADGKTERLIALCQAARAQCYLSGPSARAYIDPGLFERAGIALEFMSYDGYPEYPQLHGAFEHGVTILDLIFNTGSDARRYMKSKG